MSKTKEQKAKDKAAKKAAKAEAKTAETETKVTPEKSAAQKKRDEKKAMETYLKEPLTSVQVVKLGDIVIDMTEIHSFGTVGDLQAAIPEWQKKLDELKI